VKAPKDFRREDVKSMLSKRLGKEIIKLNPLEIKTRESYDTEQTSVCFSFERLGSSRKKLYQFKEVKAHGLVDAVFEKCHQTFGEEFKSLRHLKLVDLVVKPIFGASSRSLGSDASTDVIFRLEIAGYGVSEFSSRSKSIGRSSFVSALEAFQFYMNCDKAFYKLKSILEDANSRNRGDVAQECLSDLASLTKINSYV
tara:strand:- start:3683 stop:4276 length:594 start_codon:yes stop_codon:yes gene_type:complete